MCVWGMAPERVLRCSVTRESQEDSLWGAQGPFNFRLLVHSRVNAPCPSQILNSTSFNPVPLTWGEKANQDLVYFKSNCHHSLPG